MGCIFRIKRYGNVEWTRSSRSLWKLYLHRWCVEIVILNNLWNISIEFLIPHFHFYVLWFPACSLRGRFFFFFVAWFSDLVSDKRIDISIFEYQFNDFNTQYSVHERNKKKWIVNGCIEITVFIAVWVRTRQRSPQRLAHSEWNIESLWIIKFIRIRKLDCE